MFEDSLNRLQEIVNRTSTKLTTISELLDKGEVKIQDRTLKFQCGIDLKTVYSNGASISVVKFPIKGAMYPVHCHNALVEYLICTKGSFGVVFGNGYRILKYKECASIPENTLHSVTALEDNSEMLAICIPYEEAYKRGL